ncbi:MerR family transcriptional regulator [Cysteiniphilum halobium]|uniref:MerR family transcriptional regulator n=1 Tax=Cysteiniphilum halobium TaxID=2219059 RepID=UPI0013C3005D|nr:MerR family transcriptional regulator [Cysteiniphilum halobium]
MNVGTLAKMLGTTVRTLHYYDDIGLLKAKRTPSGYRQYDQSCVDKVKFIENAKYLGFSLNEIAELFEIENQNVSSAEVKEKINLKLKQINQRIKLLQLLKKRLIDLDRSCDGKNKSNDCSILRDLYSYNISEKSK